MPPKPEPAVTVIPAPAKSRAAWLLENRQRAREARAQEKLADELRIQREGAAKAKAAKKRAPVKPKPGGETELALLAMLMKRWKDGARPKSVAALAKLLGIENRSQIYRYPKLLDNYKKLAEAERSSSAVVQQAAERRRGGTSRRDE